MAQQKVNKATESSTQLTPFSSGSCVSSSQGGREQEFFADLDASSNPPFLLTADPRLDRASRKLFTQAHLSMCAIKPMLLRFRPHEGISTSRSLMNDVLALRGVELMPEDEVAMFGRGPSAYRIYDGDASCIVLTISAAELEASSNPLVQVQPAHIDRNDSRSTLRVGVFERTFTPLSALLDQCGFDGVALFMTIWSTSSLDFCPVRFKDEPNFDLLLESARFPASTFIDLLCHPGSRMVVALDNLRAIPSDLVRSGFLNTMNLNLCLIPNDLPQSVASVPPFYQDWSRSIRNRMRSVADMMYQNVNNFSV